MMQQMQQQQFSSAGEANFNPTQLVEDKLRYPLQEIFSAPSNDAEQKVAYVSKQLNLDYPTVHPIYFATFHQYVEQLFLRLEISKLSDMIAVFTHIQKVERNLTPKEKEHLNSTIKWITAILKKIEEGATSFPDFRQFYFETFYEQVFEVYKTQLNQIPLSSALTWASTVYLAYLMKIINPKDKAECLYYKFDLMNIDSNWDKEKAEYIATLSKMRAIRLSTIFKISIRIYWSKGSTVEVFSKVAQPSPASVTLVIENQSVEGASVPFRIGYTNTVQSLYAFQKQFFVRYDRQALTLQQENEINELQKKELAQFQERAKELQDALLKNQETYKTVKEECNVLQQQYQAFMYKSQQLNQMAQNGPNGFMPPNQMNHYTQQFSFQQQQPQQQYQQMQMQFPQQNNQNAGFLQTNNNMNNNNNQNAGFLQTNNNMNNNRAFTQQQNFNFNPQANNQNFYPQS